MEKLTMEQIKSLNVYGRLAYARVLMQEEGIKKEGQNTFQKYNYYKLDQINPVFNKAMFESGLCSHIHVTEQIAILTIKNIDNAEDEIIFSIPTVPSDMTKVSAIQARGSEITYFTRYLILQAMQIGEAEKDIDSYDQGDMNQSKKSDKPKQSGNELEDIKKEVKELCQELAKEKRAEVNAIVIKHNPKKTPSPASITDVEILKTIREELKAL